MGQGCAFWKAGCTTGELDVDRVIRLQQCPNELHLLQQCSRSSAFELRKPVHARLFFIAQTDDCSQ